ncbi:hypothetical protein [Ruixingdingia sedimenti]|uniref:Uncharacterized protein n=1 Tax=Ruixingdingia sedimenti TaxID=3073604 RepID=A0ABU1FF24_9RHOB|nr:hypothetical protein [Xinfangfangia sp. LG-4]MDR5655500.1 hypothetical protein [Xinfangfangia sp. LG-4]
MMIGVRQESWDRISEADRAAIDAITIGKLGPAIGAAQYVKEHEAFDKLRAAGYRIDTADAAFLAALREQAQPLEADWVARAREKGLADPAAILDKLRDEIAALEAAE